MNTPTPLLEKMYMYDIILQYKKLGEIIKQENGEGDGENAYEKKMDEYKNDMTSSMESYKSKINSSMPNLNSNITSMNLFNVPSLTSGLKMPKF